MKEWLRKSLWVVVPVVLTVGIVSCIARIDPATGQKTYVIDPNWAGLLDSTAKVAEVIAPAATVAASIFFPGAVPLITLIIGAVGGLVGMWKNLKPKVAQAQTLAQQTNNVLTELVNALETYKETNPDAWKTLSTELEKRIPKGSTADDVIRIIRGLLPCK